MKASIKKVKAFTTQEIVELDLIQLVKDLLASKDYRAKFLVRFLMWQVSTQVKAARLSRGWSQQKLANIAGIHYHTIIRLENPQTCLNTTINTLLKIAHAFDCGLIVRFIAYSELLKFIYEIQGVNILERITPRTSEDILERIELETWAKQKS